MDDEVSFEVRQKVRKYGLYSPIVSGKNFQKKSVSFSVHFRKYML